MEPAPSKCEVCHKLVPEQKNLVDFDPKLMATMGISDRMILNRWQRRESSGTFTHEGGAHPTLSCTTCHNIPTMNTADAATLKIAVKSCGGAEGCHITATADEGGALNYEIDQRKAKAEFQCTKCHLTFGAKPLPPNHIEAVPAQAKKVVSGYRSSDRKSQLSGHHSMDRNSQVSGYHSRGRSSQVGKGSFSRRNCSLISF